MNEKRAWVMFLKYVMIDIESKEVKMGKIEGIEIRNYGPLKNVILGKTRTHQKVR